MRNKTFRKAIAFGAGVFMTSLVWGGPDVSAAECKVYFDNSSYEADLEEEFQVKVAIDCDEQPGTYLIELEYDSSRMHYINGADFNSDGKITLEGTALDNKVEYDITFEALHTGNAGVMVSEASVMTKDGAVEFDIHELAHAQITIAGEEEYNEPDFAFETHEIAETPVTPDIPVVGKANGGDGKEYRIVDLSAFVPEICNFKYTTKTVTIGGRDLMVLSDLDHRLNLVYLMDENGDFHLYTYGLVGELYPCEETEEFYYMSPFASNERPVDLTDEVINEKNVFACLFKDGKMGFYRMNDDKEIVLWNATDDDIQKAEAEAESGPRELFGRDGLLLEYSGFIIIGAVIILWILFSAIRRHGQKKRKKKMAEDYVSSLPAEDGWLPSEEEMVPAQENWVDDELEKNYRLAKDLEKKEKDKIESQREMEFVDVDKNMEASTERHEEKSEPVQKTEVSGAEDAEHAKKAQISQDVTNASMLAAEAKRAIAEAQEAARLAQQAKMDALASGLTEHEKGEAEAYAAQKEEAAQQALMNAKNAVQLAKKAAEDVRAAEEARKAEEERLAEEAGKAEEERLAEEARKAEEERLAEEARKAEEERLAEEARKAEEARLAEEARKAEEARLAEEARKAEEARLAEEARKAEEARLAEEARKAEEARLAEEARKAEEELLLELDEILGVESILNNFEDELNLDIDLGDID